MDLLTQGLTLSISGLTVTFLSLGLFILVMVVLQALFPPESKAADNDSSQGELEGANVASELVEEEVVVAIATAVAHFDSLGRDRSLGQTLAEGPGTWWMMNRANINQGK